MQYWHDGHMDSGWSIAAALGMVGLGIFLIIAAGAVILWVARSTSGSQPAESPPAVPRQSAMASAEKILAERLARGEIQPEEYQTLLEVLNAGHEQ